MFAAVRPDSKVQSAPPLLSVPAVTTFAFHVTILDDSSTSAVRLAFAAPFTVPSGLPTMIAGICTEVKPTRSSSL